MTLRLCRTIFVLPLCGSMPHKAVHTLHPIQDPPQHLHLVVDRLPVISLLPNLRLFQCFLTETFDQLRSSFLVVFQIYVRPPNSREQLVNDDGDDSEMQLVRVGFKCIFYR
ncbi:MAG: hypothetical protein J3Q66DRAFT_117559 [Benniella sp.]|nr:MAG: hypothetical protein J3Q66DRAFT_117559 [Benniella sp.]